MTALSRIFSLAAVTLAIFSLPACSETDSSVGGSGNPLQTECKVGESKKAPDGCNTCTCQQNGFYACTEMACTPADECKAGESKKAPDGCNTCSCGADGKWACSQMACGGECKADSECGGPTIAICNKCPDGSEVCMKSACNGGKCGTEMPSCGATQCKPGETQFDGCNSCSCQANGTWSCTTKDCPPECKAGDTKVADDGCNKCACGADGTWACTQLACAPECKVDADCPQAPCSVCPDGSKICAPPACIGGKCSGAAVGCPSPEVCKPGETKVAPDGCNTCACSPDGTWACTEKACAPVCKSDADCPAPPPFCNVCSDGTFACPAAACVSGVCSIINDQCAGAVAPGQPCSKPGSQAPADDGCNTCTCGDSGTWGCTKIACVSCDGPVPSCPAPPAGCDYVGGGCVNGQWTCGNLSCNNQCKSSADCPQPGAPCQLCADGSAVCPSVDCVAGQCVGSFPTCPAPDPCATQQAKGDGLCDAFFGYAWDGASCNAVSGCNCVGSDCGNLYKSPDDCKLAHQACGSGSQCKADSDCPQPGAPCFDAVCKAGMCTLVDTCTSSACKVDSDCPQPDGPCVKCLGTNPCAKAICDLGTCTEIPPICGDVCPAQDAAGQGACDMFFGFSWNGKECVGLGGCSCVGNDCGNLYKSQAICLSIHAACQIPQ